MGDVSLRKQSPTVRLVYCLIEMYKELHKRHIVCKHRRHLTSMWHSQRLQQQQWQQQHTTSKERSTCGIGRLLGVWWGVLREL